MTEREGRTQEAVDAAEATEAEVEPVAAEVVDGPAPVPDSSVPADDGEDVEVTPDAEEAVADVPDWDTVAAEDPRSKAELLLELREAEARRDEFLDDLRRARAEFDNYRKRVMREGTAQRQAGVADLAGRLLDVLDDFDRTLDAAADSEDEALRRGVELVHDKLVQVLAAHGLSRIDETGVRFDPERHEAVQQVPADEPVDEPLVEQVFRPGYELGERILRAAMVVVKQ